MRLVDPRDVGVERLETVLKRSNLHNECTRLGDGKEGGTTRRRQVEQPPMCVGRHTYFSVKGGHGVTCV
jgi:hypothetical protein